MTVQTNHTTDTVTASGGSGTLSGFNGICKAWVQYTVSGGVITKNASFNVSSITYSATGVHVINYTNNFSDANYANLLSYSNSSGGSVILGNIDSNAAGIVAPTTSATTLLFVYRALGTTVDPSYVTYGVFR
jgi:hypothetical protein